MKLREKYPTTRCFCRESTILLTNGVRKDLDSRHEVSPLLSLHPEGRFARARSSSEESGLGGGINRIGSQWIRGNFAFAPEINIEEETDGSSSV
ncbi:hypothetical protein TNCV_4021381 [Trichonephila clavipes]|nr:hypothetical protein TNCV_4021381 [Trichonephila clavipes]